MDGLKPVPFKAAMAAPFKAAMAAPFKAAMAAPFKAAMAAPFKAAMAVPFKTAMPVALKTATHIRFKAARIFGEADVAVDVHLGYAGDKKFFDGAIEGVAVDGGSALEEDVVEVVDGGEVRREADGYSLEVGGGG